MPDLAILALHGIVLPLVSKSPLPPSVRCGKPVKKAALIVQILSRDDE